MTKSKSLAGIGLCSGILCAVSPIAIPMGDLSLSLATLAVLVSSGVLGAWKGILSVMVYLVIGGVGLPVFSGFTGGFGRLLGPTGGFLFGYLLLSFVAGLGKGRVIHMTIGTVLLYICGTVWYSVYTDVPVLAAAGVCVLPYIIPDVLKIAVAAVAVRRLKKIIK